MKINGIMVGGRWYELQYNEVRDTHYAWLGEEWVPVGSNFDELGTYMDEIRADIEHYRETHPGE